MNALPNALPRCSPSQARRVERCISSVKGQGGDANPWAVCQVEVGCSTARPRGEAEMAPDPVMEQALFGLLGKGE